MVITMQLYIIRHAQSTNNALADIRDRVCDPTLTELGERQAGIVAGHLAAGIELVPSFNGAGQQNPGGYGITHLYCSPMWRALQTAEPIGRALGLRPKVWTDIHEQGGIFLDHQDGRGPVGYPGKTRAEIQAAFPHYVLPESVNERGWWNRDFEEWTVCHQRALRVAEELCAWANGDGSQEKRIALVSHGGFIDALLKALFSHPPEHRVYYYKYNTAVSRIDFREDGRLNVRYVNRVDHLPPELVT
jgi:broad specificity phosphatase PhoE